MSTQFLIFLVLIVVVCLLLVLVVMVQNPKGGGLSSSFGGGGSQVVGGVKKTGDFLDKSTWILSGTLVVLILASNIALKGSFSASESKLINDDGIEQLDDTLPGDPLEAAPVGDPADALPEPTSDDTTTDDSK